MGTMIMSLIFMEIILKSYAKAEHLNEIDLFVGRIAASLYQLDSKRHT